MGKRSHSIQELVSKIQRNEIRLPEMQRGYVWRNTKVRDLLDSLYRNYPSGTILTWETGENVATREFSVSQEGQAGHIYQLLLDGQQRLTSLSSIIRGEPVILRGRQRPVDILFNLEHPDGTNLTEIEEDYEDDEKSEEEIIKRFERMAFVVKNRRLENLPHWVSVTDVFKSNDNAKLLRKADITSLDDLRFEKYNERLNNLRKIKEYEYDVYVLEREKSYEEVTEIFVRVNSLGTKLKGSDLALAQITAKWRGSLDIFEKHQEDCKNKGFDFELGTIIKNLVSFATNQSEFNNVAKLNKEKLEEFWPISNEGLNYAMNFLRSNIGIDNPALLASPFIVIAIAYFAYHKKYKLSPEDERKLRYWVLMANTKGHYSRGATETYLDQDLRAIRTGNELDAMIALLHTQIGRLDIREDDLENKNNRSTYFKTMFLAFRKDGARDWKERLVISLNHSGYRHKLQFHHIFPQNLLRKKNENKEKINDICNLAFIGGTTNIRISNKEPREYLADIVKEQGEEALTLQQIPTDPALWELSNYDNFLKARRKLVVERLNRFLDHGSVIMDESN